MAAHVRFTPAAGWRLDGVRAREGRIGGPRLVAVAGTLLVTWVLFAAPPAVAILVLAGVLD